MRVCSHQISWKSVKRLQSIVRQWAQNLPPPKKNEILNQLNVYSAMWSCTKFWARDAVLYAENRETRSLQSRDAGRAGGAVKSLYLESGKEREEEQFAVAVECVTESQFPRQHRAEYLCTSRFIIIIIIVVVTIICLVLIPWKYVTGSDSEYVLTPKMSHSFIQNCR